MWHFIGPCGAGRPHIMDNLRKPRPHDSDTNRLADVGNIGAAPLDTDQMETLQPGVNPMPDSPSSEADAGLIDPTRTDEDTTLDSDFDEAPPAMEVPMSDLSYDEPQLHSPVQGSMNAPGEIDMEELDEDAVRDLLPPDARLDPLED